LTQVANCDDTVPNPFGLVWASTIPTGPLPASAAFFTPGGTGTFELFVGPAFNPAAFGDPAACSSTTAATHGFLTDFVSPSLTQNAQNDAANFVMKATPAPRVQHP